MSLPQGIVIQAEAASPAPDNRVHLFKAIHPQAGQIGFLRFCDYSELKIDMLWTHDDFRRQGIASALMSALEQHYPDRIIDHGCRTEEGQAWAEAFYKQDDEQCRFTRNGLDVFAVD